MKLAELLRGVPGLEDSPINGREITSLAYDSRRVQPGSFFFAIHGEKADGNDFASAAVERGAIAIASERSAPPGQEHLWIRVPNARRALAAAALAFYGHPDE